MCRAIPSAFFLTGKQAHDLSDAARFLPGPNADMLMALIADKALDAAHGLMHTA